jgi:oligogalacturonide lyase
MIHYTTRMSSVLVGTAVAAFLFLGGASPAASVQYSLAVLPSEHKRMTDPETGVELIFLTTHAAKDTNLYFHERSWLADESVILFNSAREGGGLMGYIVKTGELIRITTPQGSLGAATAAVNRRGLYAMRGQEVVELTLNLALASDPKRTRSKATATERVLCRLPRSRHSTSLNENCDGTMLAIGRSGADAGDAPVIYVIDTPTGMVKELCSIPDPPGYSGHVQWSRMNPKMLSFAGRQQRLMVVDVRDGKPRNVYKAMAGELVTHEIWWVPAGRKRDEDQILFCGGTHPKPTEDAHVKVLNLATGVVRIVGAGAWWRGGSDRAIAKVNWWHASGSDDGRWVAADNWYGDIMLFEGNTTRARSLTTGHRTYGHGEHPHVGWDRSGNAVVFASHRLGNVDVCVARIPDSWQQANPR